MRHKQQKPWHTVEQVQAELDLIRLEMKAARKKEQIAVSNDVRENLRSEFKYINRQWKAQPRLTFVEKQTRLALKYLKAIEKVER
jgi:hypothetical protein